MYYLQIRCLLGLIFVYIVPLFAGLLSAILRNLHIDMHISNNIADFHDSIIIFAQIQLK